MRVVDETKRCIDLILRHESQLHNPRFTAALLLVLDSRYERR